MASSSGTPGDPLGTGSYIVNGQLVGLPRPQLYMPMAVGPIIQGVPASPPQTGTGGGPSGYGASDMSAKAAGNPWSPVDSPVPWIIGFIIVGYLMMRYVHWGYK